MKEWAKVHELLSGGLSDFLSEALPEIGGDGWWQNYVVEQLTPGQARSISTLNVGELRGLDLAALIRVAERSWSEFVYKRSMMRDARALLGELKVARNRYAHAPVNGVSLEDQLRDVDTARRFMQAIGASEAALNEINGIHRGLLRKMATEEDEPLTPPTPPKPIDPPPADPPAGTGLPPPPRRTATKTTKKKPSDPEVKDQGIQKVTEVGPKGGGWVIDPAAHGKEIEQAVSKKTYVGIDFGTSTSVVSVVLNERFSHMAARTLNIEQPEEFGGTISHHLVNTVLAWHRSQLFFGREAYRMRQELFEGRNVFSSFKMKLGINVGPTYPETALPRGAGGIAIEDANDATREFFRLLAQGIEKAVAKANLPSELCFAVTVPASFEANQRRDLLANMKEAGLPVSASCLIDEPNAAFLSFLHESARDQADQTLIERLKKGAANILVYDFGAGTCDVSILEVSIANGRVSSRNRAISRFTALGGDDFDRAIARSVLLPQLLLSAPGFDPELRDIEERLIPRLQPTAERLKLAAIKWLIERGLNTLAQVRSQEVAPFEDLPVPTFKIRGQELTLQRPSLSLAQLADSMKPFVERYDPDVSTAHVFAPVADAIDKSGLEADDLDAVLFIGGSASNPVVRTAVMSHLPKTVRAIIPSDLRTHVSLGAALHSLGFHAFGFDLIKPITSEPIFVIARGGKLETIIPAASAVPSESEFCTRLRVDKANQNIIELPICVSSEGKLLGLLRIHSSDADGFSVGEEVVVTARITHEKLLEIEAEVAGVTVEASLLNPLANQDLSPAETRMLEAKQQFNAALLKSGGRLPKQVVIAYAEAALSAEAFEVAADMFVAAERLDATEDHATNICYAYSKAGRKERSREWARRAHERKPTAVTAYNLACDESGDTHESLLREALELDASFPAALLALGRIQIKRGNPEGKVMIKKCVSLWSQQLDAHIITKDGCRNLLAAAELIENHDVIDRAKARVESFSNTPVYDEDNLVSSIGQPLLLARN